MTAAQLVVLLVRVALAGVFIVAAVGKLRDLERASTAAHDLGVPGGMAKLVGRALPGVELAIVVGLLVTATARWAGAAAAALLVVFSVAIAVQLGRGRRPSCNCFGGDAPIGIDTLVRNAVLAAAATTIAVVGFAGSSACAVGCPRSMSSGQVIGSGVTVVVVAVLTVHTVLLVNLLRQRGELLDRIDSLEATVAARPATNAFAAAATRGRNQSGPPLGKQAPAFELGDVDGRLRPSYDLLIGELPTVLVFLETSCSACRAISSEIGDRAARGEAPDDRRLVALVRGEAAEVATLIDRRGYEAVLVDTDGDVALEYGVPGTPCALTVLSDGRVASALFAGRAKVSRVVRPRPEQLTNSDGHHRAAVSTDRPEVSVP
jgi:peroxiredoxin